MLMGNVHRPIVCNYNLKLFLGFFYIKFQLGGFFASSQDENKICKLVSNFYLHMYLFIARLVESECKLRIIVRIFKYTYDLQGVIEVERVRKYDKPNNENNVRDYYFLKINIYDDNYKPLKTKLKITITPILHHQLLMQKSKLNRKKNNFAKSQKSYLDRMSCMKSFYVYFFFSLMFCTKQKIVTYNGFLM